MTANVNPETGIRYTMFSANQIDNEVVNQIQSEGADRHWEAYKADIRARLQREVDDGELDADDLEFELEKRLDSDNYYDDEPSHEFDIDGVQGMTTHMGGALMVWVFHSPLTARFRLCSPCVPNGCDGGSPDPDGYEGYTVPEDWFYKE